MLPTSRRQRPINFDRHSSEEAAQNRVPTVGGMLRERRDSLGWDIVDIAADLRIKVDYLVALENNDISALPGQAYATGFLRSYAEFLGLDGIKVVEQFRRQSTELRARPELNFPMPLTDRGIPGGGLVVIALIILGLCYGGWLWYSSGPHTDVASVEPVPPKLIEEAAAPPPPAEETTTSPSVAETPSPPAEQPAATPPVSPIPAATPVSPAAALPVAPVQTADTVAADLNQAAHVFGETNSGPVVVKAINDAWVEVLDNNHAIWSRLLRPGDIYNPPKDGLVLRTGNAGGIQVTLNGKVLPPFGQQGEVKRIALDASKLTGG